MRGPSRFRVPVPPTSALMIPALLAFGSNQGASEEIFAAAVKLLQETKGVEYVVASAARLTAPVGGPADQPAYLNAAIALQTSLEPSELHQRMIEIENEFGRTRATRWGARRIDLDLLLYGQVTFRTDSLTVPHPRMSFRRFVLEPAREIAAEMVHPTSGRSIAELLQQIGHEDKQVLVAGVNFSPQLVESFHKAADGLLFAFDSESFSRQAAAAKLVCFRLLQQLPTSPEQSADKQDLVEAARSFPGPTLALPHDDQLALQEFKAALAAMKAD